MLSDFTWNMTGYIPKYAVNPHGDGIIPYMAERIFLSLIHILFRGILSETVKTPIVS